MSLRFYLCLLLAGSIGVSWELHAQSISDSQHVAPAAGDTSQSVLGERLGFSPLMYAADTLGVQLPAVCLVSALRQEFRATLTAAAQRARIVIRPDTVPLDPSTVTQARKCAQTWTVANTSSFELPSLFRINMLAGHDDQARAIGARWIQMAGPQDTARGEALLRQLQWLVETRSRSPKRLEEAQRVLADLHALGPNAAEERIDALMFLQSVAGMTGTYTQQLNWVETARQLIREIPSAQQRENFLNTMFTAIATAGGDRFYFPFDLSSPELRTEIEHGRIQARRDLDTVDSQHRAKVIIPTSFHDFMYAQIGVRNDSLYVGMRLHTAAPLVAQHWYRRPDTTITYPRHGILTVIMSLNMCSATSSISCAEEYTAYRQLYHEFAPRGVDFILLAKTTGSFGLSTLLPAAAEVDSLRHYYLDSLKLPGILGIQETKFATLPDGRKTPMEGAPMPYGIVMRNGFFWPNGAVYRTSEGFENAETFLDNQLKSAADK